MSQPSALALADWEIVKRLSLPRTDESHLLIKPIFDLSRQLGPASLDLRLGVHFIVFKRSRLTHIDFSLHPDEFAYHVREYCQELTLSPSDAYILHPGEFALASTLEYIRLPPDLVARIEGRSSWGRLGLEIHATAGFIDPGFEGPITFELKNSGMVPLSLYGGLRISQLAFYPCSRVGLSYSEKSSSKYQRTQGVGMTRLQADHEFTALRELLIKDRQRAVGLRAQYIPFRTLLQESL